MCTHLRDTINSNNINVVFANACILDIKITTILYKNYLKIGFDDKLKPKHSINTIREPFDRYFFTPRPQTKLVIMHR